MAERTQKHLEAIESLRSLLPSGPNRTLKTNIIRAKRVMRRQRRGRTR